MNLISAAIKQCRERYGLSQGALGTLMGISQAHVGHLEMGTMQPTLPTLKRLAAFFKFTPDQIGQFVLDSNGSVRGPTPKKRGESPSRRFQVQQGLEGYRAVKGL